MRRSLTVSLVAFVLVAVAAVTATLATGTKPQLGLDLQGGASVVLQPRNKVPSEVLDQAIEIIRSRVDALGVAEPDIARQGETIIVALPGIKDKDRAISVVGQTAQLLFRPVIQTLPATAEPSSPTTTVPGSPPPEIPDLTTTTPPEQDSPEATVILPQKDSKQKVIARYLLGPAEVRGQAISDARAEVEPTSGTWKIVFDLTSEGTQQWNAMAVKVGTGKSIAIDLDGEVKSAPVLNSTNFSGSGEITGRFSETEAKDLALVLRYGSLPVQLDRQTVQTVSASLGKDSLRAGLLAGLVGLGLVAIYMLLYYRALGLVVWLGLILSGG
ncbi:MAG: preprotein translocase subunit SecD, partial [Acidimicrobiales bacterium]